MANTDCWFPLYIGDYLADTMHLDTREHGAYLLLLMAYYKNRGPLPNDDEFLAKITRMTVTDFRMIRSPLSKFFKIADDKWHHTRADFEIYKRVSAQNARIQGAKRTNQKLGRQTVTDTMTDSVTDTLKGRYSTSTSTSTEKGDVQSFGNPTVNGSHKPSHGKVSPSVLMISQQTELKRVEAAIQSIKTKPGTPLPLSVKPELDRLKSRRSELINSLKFAV